MKFRNFLLLFMFLSISLILENSHILVGIYFIFLKSLPRSNLKGFPYEISRKRSRKKLSSKTNFSSFLQISCSNFRLKRCERP